jgi:hypothetical protein
MPNPSMRNANPSHASTLGPVTGAIFASLMMTGCAVGAGGCNEAKFTAQQTRTLTASAESSLRIENMVGDVKVVADPAASGVTMELTLIGKGTSQAKADEALRDIELNVNDPAGDTGVTATAKHPSNGGGWSGKQWEVRWVVTAPPSVKIDVDDDVGNITIVGFERGAKVSTDVGDVKVSGVMGGVVARTDVGNAVVNAQGPADVTTNVGNVRLELMGESSNIRASADVGSIHLVMPPEWAGKVTGKSDVGEVKTVVPGLATKSDMGGGGRVSGNVGSGSSSATLSADVGSITIEQREVKRALN